jgi:uncharacterized protein YhbP (UPF0306 family)
MCLATVGSATTDEGAGSQVSAAPEAPAVPHVASLFYATDAEGRLIFLSMAASRHGHDLKSQSRAAVAVTEQYEDWREIKGVQLHGSVEVLRGVERLRGLATYLARFPFVRELVRLPGKAGLLESAEVFRFVPSDAAFTDNSTGVFGREEWHIGSA